LAVFKGSFDAVVQFIENLFNLVFEGLLIMQFW
jgi:hypothetical protein